MMNKTSFIRFNNKACFIFYKEYKLKNEIIQISNENNVIPRNRNYLKRYL